jgi:uncharacterized Zn-binding protein involved in type VI secretion
MPPAARITDMHVCPMVTGVVPHVGGPILPPGAPTVLIDFLPAATVTSMATCVGPPDMIVMGSLGVMINFLPAARLDGSHRARRNDHDGFAHLHHRRDRYPHPRPGWFGRPRLWIGRFGSFQCDRRSRSGFGARGPCRHSALCRMSLTH